MNHIADKKNILADTIFTYWNELLNAKDLKTAIPICNNILKNYESIVNDSSKSTLHGQIVHDVIEKIDTLQSYMKIEFGYYLKSPITWDNSKFNKLTQPVYISDTSELPHNKTNDTIHQPNKIQAVPTNESSHIVKFAMREQLKQISSHLLEVSKSLSTPVTNENMQYQEENIRKLRQFLENGTDETKRMIQVLKKRKHDCGKPGPMEFFMEFKKTYPMEHVDPECMEIAYSNYLESYKKQST